MHAEVREYRGVVGPIELQRQLGDVRRAHRVPNCEQVAEVAPGHRTNRGGRGVRAALAADRRLRLGAARAAKRRNGAAQRNGSEFHLTARNQHGFQCERMRI